MSDRLFDVPAPLEGGRAGDATFDPDRRYRYDLWRSWDDARPVCGWVMLNPSTGDEKRLDPTLRRVLRYSDRWGYGACIVRNLFALCATDPHQLVTADDPIGPDNDKWLRNLAIDVDCVVVAWGTGPYPRISDRWEHVAEILAPTRPVCLNTAQDGQPIHPLYQRADLINRPWPDGQVAR